MNRCRLDWRIGNGSADLPILEISDGLALEWQSIGIRLAADVCLVDGHMIGIGSARIGQ